MSYLTDGTLGAKLDRIDVSAAFSIGIKKMGNEGSEWMYVLADADIAQYMAVRIDQSSKAILVSTLNAVSSRAVGFAQTSIASGKYSWVAIQGSNIQCHLAADCAPNVPLYTTGVGGVLDDAIASGGVMFGVVATVTISNTTAVRIIAHNPHIGQQIGV